MHTIYYPNTTDRYRLWHLTDTHIGAKACDEKLLRQHIQAIADDENARWIGGGDYVDAIHYHDRKRFKPETVALWALSHTNMVGKQVEYFLDLTAPIARKCLGLASGNHESENDKYHGGSCYQAIVETTGERKGVPPETLGLGVQGFVTLTFRLGAGKLPNGGNHAWRMSVFVHHGWGGGRKAGGDALTLEQALLEHDSDLLLMGHRHVFRALDVQVFVPGKHNAVQRERWGVMSRGYLRGFIEDDGSHTPIDTYSEEKGLPVRGVGAFPIEIEPQAHRLRILVEGHTR